MNILVFDTATEKLAAALKSDNEIFTITADQGFRHSEKLLPSAEKLFDLSGSSIDDIDLIGCTRGPGSFTGLRIGMATAKGLAFGKKIPLVSVPTLDLYSWGYSSFDGAVLPLIDARKKRFYTAVYSGGSRKTDYLDLTPEEIRDTVKSYKKILLTGPHTALFLENYGKDERMVTDPFAGFSKIEFLIDICEQMYKNGISDSDSQGPVYIRKSDAEEAFSAGNLCQQKIPKH